MSLAKRHIGRRAAGVGVAVALMMLGLAAPASAVTPTVGSFLPTSGPVGCLTVITGTSFDNPDVSDVLFSPTDATGTPTVSAPDFAVISATEIWAVVPAGAADGPIAVENASGVGVSPTTFDVTTTAGGCAPTVTNFLPICGSSGDIVTITGTNLLNTADPGVADTTDVRFSPYGNDAANGLATHTTPNADTPTSLTVIVPSGAADGPIRVSTFNDTIGEGAVLSAARFDVPPPDCGPVTGNEHARTISLKMKKNGRASGIVSSTEDPAFTDCVASVPVKLKYKKKGKSWKNAGRTSTTLEGNYALKTKGKPGKYKAIAVKVNIGDPVTDVCLKARSPIRKIRR